MTSSGSESISIWSGLDVQTDDPKQIQEIETFFADGYLDSVLANNPGVISGKRYELIEPDRHRGFGSRYLTIFNISDKESADEIPPVADTPLVWNEAVESRWSLRYRYVTETGPNDTRPYAIYVVGVDPPKGASDAEIVEFNDFYTNTHIHEVLKRRRGLRATRFELDRELVRPIEGSPHFLTTYEVDEKGASVTRHIGAGYSRGPTVWAKHKTVWRLWYRLLDDQTLSH